MQKKVIALAVAGLVSGAAFAQNNVTIYGLIDAGMEFGKYNSTGGSVTRVQSGQTAGSRIGFKGEEALGNGLKAVWTLEQGIQVDTGMQTHSGGATNVGPAFGRQAFAGLSSATLGTATVGRQYTPAFGVQITADAFANGYGAGLNNSISAATPGYTSRIDNSVAYTSPNFSGFQAVLAHSTGTGDVGDEAATRTQGTDDKAGRVWAGSATYTNGPLWIGASYQDITGAANNIDNKYYLLGGTYDFKVAKLFAAYNQGKQTTAGALSDKKRGYSVGVRVPFGAHTVIAQYSHRKDKDTVNSDMSLWGVGYEYAMSKRTNLYAGYSKLNNESAGTNTMGPAGGGTIGQTVNAGYDPRVLQVGFKHSF